ncbi:MAG TPA: hypothetical protein VGE11_24615 [Pseudonocardia sp.]
MSGLDGSTLADEAASAVPAPVSGAHLAQAAFLRHDPTVFTGPRNVAVDPAPAGLRPAGNPSPAPGTAAAAAPLSLGASPVAAGPVGQQAPAKQADTGHDVVGAVAPVAKGVVGAVAPVAKGVVGAAAPVANGVVGVVATDAVQALPKNGPENVPGKVGHAVQHVDVPRVKVHVPPPKAAAKAATAVLPQQAVDKVNGLARGHAAATADTPPTQKTPTQKTTQQSAHTSSQGQAQKPAQKSSAADAPGTPSHGDNPSAAGKHAVADVTTSLVPRSR